METIWKVTSSEWEVAWSRKDHAFPLSFSEPKTSKCKLAKVIGEKGQPTGTLQDMAWLLEASYLLTFPHFQPHNSCIVCFSSR